MSLLPYFKWYPADAESDEKYASMTDQELGFFHRCLNKSWVNGGLPSDEAELARLLKVSPAYLKKVWPRVSQCFVPMPDSNSRIGNPRQEKERAIAMQKSENNKRPGNANATRIKRERDLIVNDSDTRIEREKTPRAYESESDCVFVLPVLPKKKKEPEKPKAAESPSSRFSEFWSRYPVKENRPIAEGVFISLVTTDNEAKMFSCLQRYVESDRAERAPKNPANWLHDCARDNWESDWPKAAQKQQAPPPRKIEYFDASKITGERA